MKITILGSGDTRGIPKVGCTCPTCTDARRSGFERKRFGILVESEHQGNRTRILVDASPDLRRAFLQHGFSPKDLDALLLTHEHYDHVAGIGEFFFEGRTVPLYARLDCIDHVFSEHAYGYLRNFKVFDFRPVEFMQPITIGGSPPSGSVALADSIHDASIRVTPVPLNHSIETAGYVFESQGKKVAVLTDCRADLPKETEEAIRGCDLLVTDGWLEDVEQFKEAYRAFHPGMAEADLDRLVAAKKRNHMLIPEAIDLVQRVAAKKTVLLHVAHAARPHADLARTYDSECVRIGSDGLVLTV